MLGAVAISERAVSDQGAIFSASQSINAQFDVANNGLLVANGVSEMEAIATKTSIGVGVLSGIIEASANFTQSSDLLRFATGVSGTICTSVQTSDGLS